MSGAPPTTLLDPDTLAPAVSSDFFSSDLRGIALAGLQSALSLGDLARPAEPAPHSRLISAQYSYGDPATKLVSKADELHAHDPFRARFISATDGYTHTEKEVQPDRAGGEGDAASTFAPASTAPSPPCEEEDTGENAVEAAASPARVQRPVDEELLEAAGGGRLHLP